MHKQKRDANRHPFYTPAAIRTRDLQLRRLTLYPAELRVLTEVNIHHLTAL